MFRCDAMKFLYDEIKDHHISSYSYMAYHILGDSHAYRINGEEHGDQIRNAVKDINNLKTELREIKNLLREIVK